jgi:thioredoxin-dependent peroxiredoxin
MKPTLPRSLILAGLFAILPGPAGLLWANPPDFTVTSATSPKTFTLSAAKGNYVVLHFLLKTECPFCLKHTRDHLAKTSALPGTVQIFLKPDTEAEIRTWTEHLKAEDAAALPIYQDTDARLAKEFNIPDGYAFHGQTIHYPATLILAPDGREVFRYVGKKNTDRLSTEALAAQLKALQQP